LPDANRGPATEVDKLRQIFRLPLVSDRHCLHLRDRDPPTTLKIDGLLARHKGGPNVENELILGVNVRLNNVGVGRTALGVVSDLVLGHADLAFRKGTSRTSS